MTAKIRQKTYNYVNNVNVNNITIITIPKSLQMLIKNQIVMPMSFWITDDMSWLTEVFCYPRMTCCYPGMTK